MNFLQCQVIQQKHGWPELVKMTNVIQPVPDLTEFMLLTPEILKRRLRHFRRRLNSDAGYSRQHRSKIAKAVYSIYWLMMHNPKNTNYKWDLTSFDFWKNDFKGILELNFKCDLALWMLIFRFHQDISYYFSIDILKLPYVQGRIIQENVIYFCQIMSALITS